MKTKINIKQYSAAQIKLCKLWERKGVVFILLFIMNAITSNCYGQIQFVANDSNSAMQCDVRLAYSNNGTPEAPINTYTNLQTLSCDKIRFYFEDMLNTTTYGFDDINFGLQRRNTLCAVATYLQTIFNFNQVPASDPICIEIRQSYINPQNPPPTSWANVIATGGPVFQTLTAGQSGFFGGNFYSKTNAYNQYVNNGFDARITVNFSANNVSLSNGEMVLPLCRTDLFTVLLHEMVHCMGWLSAVENGLNNTPIHSNSILPNNSNAFTKYDEHFLFHGDIFTNSFQKFVLNGAIPTINPILSSTNNCMIDNMTYSSNLGRFQDNQPIYSGSTSMFAVVGGSVLHHLDEQYMVETIRNWVTPGFTPRYVMGPFSVEGIEKRELSLQEIRMLLEMGYNLNSIYGASTGTGLAATWAVILNSNHKPECTTGMNNPQFSIAASNWAEGTNIGSNNVTIDFPNLVNDNTVALPNTTQLIIDLNSMPAKIFDADNDIIQMLPATIVGIRGVGNLGNNHARLQLINGNTQIVYTPSPNFIGTAQFYGRLFDGKEQGAEALFTINVMPGNNIANFAMGDNKVVNGSFEEGTELKTQLNQTTRGNSSEGGVYYSKEYSAGYLFSDGHPLSYYGIGAWSSTISGMKIFLASKQCSQPTLPYNFGNGWNHFPAFTLNIPFGNNATIPNDRYSDFNAQSASPPWNNSTMHTNYSNLLTPVDNTEMLRLEFDIYIPSQLNITSLNVDAGFVNTPVVFNPVTNYNINFQLPTTTTNSWFHVIQDFQYCSNTPLNYLDLIPYYQSMGILDNHIYIDNISLREIQPTPLNITSIFAAPNPTCIGQNVQLGVTVSPITCNIVYNWSPSATLNSSNIPNPISNATVTTTYTVVASDANLGQSTSATITVIVNPLPTITASASPSNTICEGQQIILSGGGGLTYSWTSGVINGVSFIPTTTSTYTVVGVDANGCSNSASITINVNPSPPITVSAFPSTSICTGQQVILTGGGANSYSWSGGVLDGVPFVPLTTTTYTVTGTNSNGCTNTATVTISVNLNPVFTLSASSNCVGGSTPTSVITALPNAYTYTFSGGIVSSNTTTVNTSNTYLVTATTANGCTSTQSIYIANCNSCLQAPANSSWYSNPTSANFPSGIMPTTPIVIDGILNLTSINLLLANNSSVYFTPNSQAVLSSGRTFTVSNSTLRGCSQMWKGIKADLANETININTNSKLQDMLSGVQSINGAHLDIENSHFIDNNVGIYIINSPLGYNQSNGCIIRNNLFNSTLLPLLPPLSSLLKSDLGIQLEKCQEVEIGHLNIMNDKNTFTNLYTGIYSIPTPPNIVQNINIWNNDFEGITDDVFTGQWPIKHIIDNCYQTRKGAGIYMETYNPIPMNFPGNTRTLNVKCVTGGGKFKGCDKAIVGSFINASIKNVLVDNAWMGFMFTNSDKQKMQIGYDAAAVGDPTTDDKNEIQDVFIGTQIIGNVLDNSYIKYNTIKLKNTGVLIGTNVQQMWGVGIDIRQVANPTSQFDIWSNNIEVSHKSGTGIRLANTGIQLKCLINTVNFITSDASSIIGQITIPELIGIELNNCTNSLISGNHINGINSLAAYNVRQAEGIKINRSTKLTLECNHVNNTRYGFWTIDACGTVPSNGVVRNDFENHRHGMFFTFGANEGTLNDIGVPGIDNNNSFINSNAFKPYYNFNKLFRVALNSNNPNNIYSNTVFTSESDASISSSKYVVQNGNATVLSNCIAPYTILPSPDDSSVIDDDFAMDVINDSIPSESFPEMGEYMLQRELYEQLYGDSIGRVSNSMYNNFYNNMSDSVLGKLYAIDKRIQDLDEGLLSSQIVLGQALNNSIISTRLIALNEKEINNIYFDYLNYGWIGLSNTQKQFTESLAKSCLYTAGLGVNKARMLWANEEPGLDYDDLYICTGGNNKTDVFSSIKDVLSEDIIEINNGHTILPPMLENEVILYPNPAKEMVTVWHSFKETKELRMELYDQTGRMVKAVICKGCNVETVVELKGLANGIYNYKVIHDGNLAKVGKLSIVN